MDFVKETHDLLHYYLSTEHRGKKQLGPEHDDLRKDIQNLVLHAFKAGKANGISSVSHWVTTSGQGISDTINRRYVEAINDVKSTCYKSKANVSK